MSREFIEKCGVTKWFWWRVLVITVLFAGLSGYFFYDWKVGYPKKNYKLVQYNTFKKAKEYFLKHVEMGRSPEQWRVFVSEQAIEHHQDKKIVSSGRASERYPKILQDYTLYAKAHQERSSQDFPVLWEEYATSKRQEVMDIKKTFSSPPSKEDKRKLKGYAKWDEPLPSSFKKGEEEGNYRLLLYQTFKEAEELFKQHKEEGKSAEDWAFLTSCRDLAFPRQVDIIPAAYQEEKWASILGNYEEFYKQAEKEIKEGVAVNKPYLWKEFTAEQKWGDTPPKDIKGRDKIREQLYFGVGVAALALITTLLGLRMRGRFMAVDEEAYYAPGRVKIPFSQIKKIDKRKWDTKGLATLYYEENGTMKRTRVDGMVYGQFDKEAGEPAEKLFQAILAHFKGELIEFISEEAAEAE